MFDNVEFFFILTVSWLYVSVYIIGKVDCGNFLNILVFLKNMLWCGLHANKQPEIKVKYKVICTKR